MRVINELEQNSPEWLAFRRAKIGGSNAKDIKPLTRGPMKGLPEGSAGFWRLTAEKIAIDKLNEADTSRGHRLEDENLRRTNDKFGLSMEKIGVWVSDYSDDIYISPDGGDAGNEPVNAFESKAFDSHKHLSIIWNDIQAKKSDDYNPLLSLPSDNQDQAIKYFNVAPTLKRLYWALFDELNAYDELVHYVITISREDVADFLEVQRSLELAALKRRDEIIKEMLEELRG